MLLSFNRLLHTHSPRTNSNTSPASHNPIPWSGWWIVSAITRSAELWLRRPRTQAFRDSEFYQIITSTDSPWWIPSSTGQVLWCSLPLHVRRAAHVHLFQGAMLHILTDFFQYSYLVFSGASQTEQTTASWLEHEAFLMLLDESRLVQHRAIKRLDET